MHGEQSDIPPLVDLTAELERAFIDEYLVSRGYDPLAVAALPDDLHKALFSEASRYASAKLSEVEARAHYLHDIHWR